MCNIWLNRDKPLNVTQLKGATPYEVVTSIEIANPPYQRVSAICVDRPKNFWNQHGQLQVWNVFGFTNFLTGHVSSHVVEDRGVNDVENP